MAGEFSILWIEEILQELDLKYEYEFKFAKEYGREWAFDFYVKDYSLGIEFHGGQFTNGGHTRPIGYGKDLFKFNAAQILGYSVLQFTTEHSREYIKVAITAAVEGANDDFFKYGKGNRTRQRNTLEEVSCRRKKKKSMKKKV